MCFKDKDAKFGGNSRTTANTSENTGLKNSLGACYSVTQKTKHIYKINAFPQGNDPGVRPVCQHRQLGFLASWLRIVIYSSGAAALSVTQALTWSLW